MLDNYQKLVLMTAKERAKLVKTSCRKLKNYNCKVIEVYISLYTFTATISFEYENEVHEICAINVKDTWQETKIEIPTILLKELNEEN